MDLCRRETVSAVRRLQKRAALRYVQTTAERRATLCTGPTLWLVVATPCCRLSGRRLQLATS